MKQILLSLLALFAFIGMDAQSAATSSPSGATPLMQKFVALSKIPGIKQKDTMKEMPLISADVLDDVKIVAVENADAQTGMQFQDAVFNVLNTIDMKMIINGGSNNLISGFVYANRIVDDKYEVLMAAGCADMGFFAIIYGVTDAKTVSMIQQSPFVMQGESLKLQLDPKVKGSLDYLFNIVND